MQHLGRQTGRAAIAVPDTPDARLAALATYPPLAVLKPFVRAMIANRLRPEHFVAGSNVLAIGEPADRLFVIRSGHAEVVAPTSGGNGELLLAVLGPGEGFGEMALVTGGRRTATVRAVTALDTYSLSVVDFRQLMAEHDEVRQAVRDLVAELERATFLKRSTPFACLDAPQLRRLAEQIQPRVVPAGTVLMREGEVGDWCAVVRRGRLGVRVRSPAGVEEEKAMLGPGASVGEMALLTGAPRSATVVTLEETELWQIHLAAFETALAASTTLLSEFQTLLGARARPRRRTGISVSTSHTDSGEPVYVLRDTDRWTYFQLSADGLAIWELLDGNRTLGDIVQMVEAQAGRAGGTPVVPLVRRLIGAGFVETPQTLALYRPSAFRLGTLIHQARRWLRGRPPRGLTRVIAYCSVTDVEARPGLAGLTASVEVELAARDGYASGYRVSLPLVPQLDLAFGDSAELHYDRGNGQVRPVRLVNRRSSRTFEAESLRTVD
ncbi:MAG: cyclic nucleotide-binding domain-containing protein [Chloroflexi bacterium]|nr:cyclic nucleotide-binding domain-containing protein [Chloroflexota bacterium]